MELRRFVVLAIGLFICYFIFNLSTGMFGYSIAYDIITRHNPNDSFISSYYLMWTVVYYIPVFTIFLIFNVLNCYETFTYKYLIVYTSIMICIVLYYMYELVDFFAVNSTLYSVVGSEPLFNQLLVNMLNSYHPYLFYLCAGYYIYRTYVLYIVGNSSWTDLAIVNNFRYFNTTNYLLLVISFLFLYLGSWWANQEGNWGGWWNSDSSEMLGLLLGLIPLVWVHTRIVWYNYYSSYGLSLNLFINFTLLYYFLQINYELSSHNFGLQSFIFFNNNTLFTLFILVLLAVNTTLELTNYLNVVTCSYVSAPQLLSDNKYYMNSLTLLLIFMLVWITLSLLPLVTTFNTQSYYIMDNAVLHLYGLLTVYLYIYVSSIFFRITSLSAGIGLFLSLLQTPVLAYLIFVYSPTNQGLGMLHWLFLVFVGLNVITGNYLFFFTYTAPHYSSMFWSDSFYIPTNLLFVNEGFTVNQISVSLNSDSQFLNSWTSASLSNSNDSDDFILQFNNQTMVNSIYLVNDYLRNTILIEFNEVYLLNLVSLLVLYPAYMVSFSDTPTIGY